MSGKDVSLAHVRAVLESPSGFLKGWREATFSLVLLRESGKRPHFTSPLLLPPPIASRRSIREQAPPGTCPDCQSSVWAAPCYPVKRCWFMQVADGW